MPDKKHGILEREKTALLVVDYQEKLFPYVLNREQVQKRAIFAIQCLRRLQIPIVVSEQYPKGLGVTVPEIQEALGDDYKPIPKTAFSCMGEPALVQAIDDLDIENLLIIGIETHICVAHTALDALKDYRVHVLVDALSARNELDHEIGALRIRRAGAVLSTTEMAVYELLREAKTPDHKLLFDLLK